MRHAYIATPTVMAASCRILFALFFVHLLGIGLFIVGFLLTRTVIPMYSLSCNATDQITSQFDRSPCLSGDELKFKRVVWILIDALRYDFVKYDSIIGPNPPFYLNQMMHVNKYLNEYPRNIKLYRFVADPPTTTMQRLKALTTGSLPTFVDIGSNFNSYEVTEDNLVFQCNKNGRRVTFMGDDTWMGLYPRLIDKSFPYPSLNVKDLHTVDNGVIEHMLPQLKETDDVEFIIGHLLGVDHCGHTHGPAHPLMKQKLIQMDKFLRDVFESVSNDTIVFVFGDHGMTATGDHGGETPLETDSALLIYSPLPIFNPNENEVENQLYQTDIVPTVALLLGIPIPFSNLGMIIPDLFINVSSQPLTTGTSPRHPHGNLHYLTALNLNMNQLYEYLKALIKYDSSFTTSAIDSLLKHYHSTRNRYKLSMLSGHDNETEVDAIIEEMIRFIRGMRSVCTEKWAKFNDTYISIGIAVLILHLIAVWGIFVYHHGLIGIASKLVYRISAIDLPSLLSIALMLFHSFSLFSNSFIVFEQNTVHFSIQTVSLVLAFQSLKQTLSKGLNDRSIVSIQACVHTLRPYIILLVCVRLSAVYHTCRDQQDECTVPEFLKPLTEYDNMTTPLSLTLGGYMRIVVLCVSVYFYRRAVRHFENTLHLVTGTGNRVSTGTRYRVVIFTMAREVVYIAVLIPLLESRAIYIAVTLPWIVYVSVIVGVLLLVYKPWLRFNIKLDQISHSTSCSLPAHPFSWPVSLVLVLVLCPIVLVLAVPNDSYIVPVGLMVLQLSVVVRIFRDSPQVSLVTRAVLCSLFVDQYFFALGHQATVNSLEFEAGFVGIHGNMTSITLVLAGILVGINTLASQIIGPIALPLLVSSSGASRTSYLNDVFKLQLLYIGCGSLKMVCIVVCASVLRRHLMLWAVFGPRFMYEAAFQTLSIVMTILIHLFVYRAVYQYDNYQQNIEHKRN